MSVRSIGRINALFTQVQQPITAVASPGNCVTPPPNPAAMEVAALKSSPFLQPSTPPAIRHNESLLRWPEFVSLERKLDDLAAIDAITDQLTGG